MSWNDPNPKIPPRSEKYTKKLYESEKLFGSKIKNINGMNDRSIAAFLFCFSIIAKNAKAKIDAIDAEMLLMLAINMNGAQNKGYFV